MGTIQRVALGLVLAGLTLSSVASAGVLGRDEDPVVLEGAALTSFQGTQPSRIVAFRFEAGWTPVPVQVDERAVLDFGRIYGQAPTGATTLTYTDDGTFAGADPDAGFDADDELVFMARHVADRWDGRPEPAGTVPGTRVELLVVNPLDGSQGYLYLFETDGTLDPAAGAAPIDYTFNLLSGDYKTTYRTRFGPNPEDSRVTTSSYAVHFADRWIRDETRVTAGSADGTDLLDRHKSQFAPGQCGRTHETFSNGEGAFIVNRSGPVRALRGYVGANSGPTTHRIHRFYEEREEIVTVLRVHAIVGIVNFFDYDPVAAGMTYHNDLNPVGVTVNGTPDVVAPGQISWEMVTGDLGTLAMAWSVDTDVPNPGYTSFYSDDAAPANMQCTGDAFEYGASGLWKNDGIPNTDPEGPQEAFRLIATRTIRYGAPNQVLAFAESHYARTQSPLSVTVEPGAGCPDADADGWAVCDGVCVPSPGDQCGDCDDLDAAVSPGATEVCGNGVDDDCDGLDPACAPCPDLDTDGWAVCDPLCAPDPGDQCGDCDDTAASVNPGATEVCDSGVDEDCDGLDPSCVACADGDADGWAVCDGACVPDPDDQCGDCDDTAASVNPAAMEVCSNGVDEDCDGRDLPCAACPDMDSDDWAVCDMACLPQPEDQCGDCNDLSAGVNPGATETCDLQDNDCDATTPDGAGEPWLGMACDGPDSDLCNEGTLLCSAGQQTCSDTTTDSLEVCDNGLDDDCDGLVDGADSDCAGGSEALSNLSTRSPLGPGDGVPIGGFIIGGLDPKTVLVRALGPSLSGFGVPDPLGDPTLELYAGQTLVVANDDWAASSEQQAISDTGLAPPDASEPAILWTLQPGEYTAIVRGKDGETGHVLIEIYEVDPAQQARLTNISTRGPVGTGESVLIGGLEIEGVLPKRVLIRALGPTLASFGVGGVLADPELEVLENQTVLVANDDWASSPRAGEIQGEGLAPPDPAESAVILDLAPGSYTVVVRGVGGTTGIALVEVYDLDAGSPSPLTLTSLERVLDPRTGARRDDWRRRLAGPGSAEPPRPRRSADGPVVRKRPRPRSR